MAHFECKATPVFAGSFIFCAKSAPIIPDNTSPVPAVDNTLFAKLFT